MNYEGSLQKPAAVYVISHINQAQIFTSLRSVLILSYLPYAWIAQVVSCLHIYPLEFCVYFTYPVHPILLATFISVHIYMIQYKQTCIRLG